MATARLPAEPPRRLLDDSFLKFLPAVMREPRRAWLAIPVAWALSIAGSLILALASRSLAPGLAEPSFPMKGITAFLLLVVFAPFVETLIMAGFLTLFVRLLPPAAAILLSAAGWGVAHSAQALGWGLVIWWPFLIFSTLYVVWRQRGFWAGVAVATAAHMLQNLGPGILVAFG
ncbi:MAG TPA: CPBP family glutamic-type intramembrane protease [Sphingomicrobium sp.]|nr:CPBP family glutamic-type intramembrane protease [Sphingomicrobium sp.]